MIRIILLSLLLIGCQTVTTVVPLPYLTPEYKLVNSHSEDISLCKKHLIEINTLSNSSCMTLWNKRIPLYKAVKYIEKDQRNTLLLLPEQRKYYTNGKELSNDLRDIVTRARNVQPVEEYDDFGDDYEDYELD